MTKAIILWVNEVRESSVTLPCAAALHRLGESNETLTASEMTLFLSFCGDQMGRWLAQYDFSPAKDPDRAAEAEVSAWLNLWNTTADAVCELAPTVRRADLEKVRDLHGLKYAAIRRDALERVRPIRNRLRLLSAPLGVAADRIGLRTIGGTLYKWSVYPTGTVGRARS